MKLREQPAAFLPGVASLEFRGGAVVTDLLNYEILIDLIGEFATFDGVSGIPEGFNQFDDDEFQHLAGT